MAQKILVTGASGLLGVNIAETLSRDHIVTGVWHSHPVYPPTWTAVQADLTDSETVKELIRTYQPDCVIHCAALADLKACEENPKAAELLNVRMAEIIAAATRYQAKLVHISTDAVFNGERGNYTEQDTPDPINEYGKSKLRGEIAVLSANADALVVRTNLYGFSISGKRSLAEFFLTALLTNNQVSGFSDAIFSAIETTLLAKILGELSVADVKGIIHVGTTTAWSKYQFGVQLAKVFGFSHKLIVPKTLDTMASSVPRGRNLSLNVDRLTQLLDITYTAEESLHHLHKLYKSNYPEHIRTLDVAL